MKVGIIYKKSKVKDERIVTNLVENFKFHGAEAVILNGYDELKDLDVVLVLGGDGAILHSAVPASKNRIKIIGVNYGTLGFLTEYESRDTDKVVSLICDGNYELQKRSVLEVEINGKKHYCLNEVSLQRNTMARVGKQMTEFTVTINGEEMSHILSDGLIVCTPTGSTAYSLSAGGSIMTPDLKAFMLTPICAFSLRSRPVVFSDEEELQIGIVRKSDGAVVFGDGRFIGEVSCGETVRVGKAPFTADFITEKGQIFWKKLTSKLGD